MSRRVAIVDPLPLRPLGPEAGTTYIGNLLLALCAHAGDFGFEPLVRFSREGGPPLSPFPETPVDGAIYVDRFGLPDTRTLADALDMPVVTVGSDREMGVWADSREGIRLAFRHLYELGHRSILHFRGPDSLFASRERADEFALELERHPDVLGRYVDDEEEMMAEFMRPDRCTGMVAFCDGYAIRANRAARECSLDLPKDLSATGFDDDVQGWAANPSLTTITQSTDLAARLAYEKLTEWLDSGRPPTAPSIVPVALKVRQSTRRPGEG